MSFLHDLGVLLPSVGTTLWLTTLSFAIGFPLSVVCALALRSRRGIVTVPLVTVLEILRGMPALLTLYFVYYGLPEQGLTLSSTLSCCIAFALTFVAYTAPILSSAIALVPPAHIEAASALGLGSWTVSTKVILPQAIKAALPPLVTWTIILFQGTSLAGWVGTNDLFATTKSLGAQDYRYLYHLLIAAAFYALISIPFLWFATRLEGRNSGSGVSATIRRLLRNPVKPASELAGR